MFNSTETIRVRLTSAGVAAFLAGMVGCTQSKPVKLIYDAGCPIIYDNDSVEDAYTDELVMALATGGRIDLRGFITTSGGWRDPWDTDRLVNQHSLNGRKDLVAKAHRSGMTMVPAIMEGVSMPLEKPLTGHVEDTRNPGSEGARLIVKEALKATRERPLVVIIGGSVSTVADAYLLEPGITDRVIVAWNGYNNWNGKAKPFRWASEIVLRNFRCVLFSKVTEVAAPSVPKSRLSQLPVTELRRYMIDKSLPSADLPREHDFDASPVIPLIDPNYVLAVRRMHWSKRGKDGESILEPDATGNIWQVERASRRIATRAWWLTMRDPNSWGGAPEAKLSRFALRGNDINDYIEAEDFDEGGPEVAYHDSDKKTFAQSSERDITAFRPLEHVDFTQCEACGGGYYVSHTSAGEWLSYEIRISTKDEYQLDARVNSNKDSGQLRFKFESAGHAYGKVMTAFPRVSGWHTLRIGSVVLAEGDYTLRVAIDKGNIDLDWFRLSNKQK